MKFTITIENSEGVGYSTKVQAETTAELYEQFGKARDLLTHRVIMNPEKFGVAYLAHPSILVIDVGRRAKDATCE
jgi:hypothetical protein